MKIFKQCWSGVTQDTEQHGHVIAYRGRYGLEGGDIQLLASFTFLDLTRMPVSLVVVLL